MNSLLRRMAPSRTAWVCRRCYTTSLKHVTTPARTRFAPSPTGFLHLGSLRTALFNYLLAKNTGGQFILRIEDTDQKRTVPGAEESIYETLRWAGLQWDEGPQVGGEYGPYRQSERSELHRTHADELLTKGYAYRCFCGTNRLSALATKRQASGMPAEYDRHCYKIPASESEARADKGESHVIRLKIPDEYPPFTDNVYGQIHYTENAQAHSQGSFEDPIILKSDGMPTYHLANVVDDHYMHITHVLRATEWLPSTPKHMYLYSCFGWTPPEWAHVGLLQDKKQAKLSKRDGSTMVSSYRDAGYTAETLNNFVALLGWSHGGEGRSDVMSMKGLIKLFDVKKLTQGNTIVNFEKLDFLQKSHIRDSVKGSSATEEVEVNKLEKIIRKRYGDTLETGAPLTHDYVRKVLRLNLHNYLIPERFVESTRCFFQRPVFESKNALMAIKNLLKFFRQSGCSVWELYHGFIEELERIPDTEEGWNLEALKEAVNWEQDLDREVWSIRMRLLRLALMDGEGGPSLGETILLLGKKRSLERLEGVLAAFERELVVKNKVLVKGEKRLVQEGKRLVMGGRSVNEEKVVKLMKEKLADEGVKPMK